MTDKKSVTLLCHKSLNEINKHYVHYRCYFQSPTGVLYNKEPRIFSQLLLNYKWCIDSAMGHFNGKLIDNMEIIRNLRVRETWEERWRWDEGDTVEVYSNSDGYWYAAEIINVSEDGKWIEVENKCLRKELLRKSNNLRPMSISLKDSRREIIEICNNHEIVLNEAEYSHQTQNAILGYVMQCKVHGMEQKINILQESLRKSDSEKRTQNKKIDFMTKIMNQNNECFDDMKHQITDKDDQIDKLKMEIKQKDAKLHEYENSAWTQHEIKTQKRALYQLNRHLNRDLIKRENELKQRDLEFKAREIAFREREIRLKQRELQFKEREECIVCMDKSRQFACVPCGHRCLCFDCVNQINDKCPICRAEIESTVRVYE